MKPTMLVSAAVKWLSWVAALHLAMVFKFSSPAEQVSLGVHVPQVIDVPEIVVTVPEVAQVQPCSPP